MLLLGLLLLLGRVVVGFAVLLLLRRRRLLPAAAPCSMLCTILWHCHMTRARLPLCCKNWSSAVVQKAAVLLVVEHRRHFKGWIPHLYTRYSRVDAGLDCLSVHQHHHEPKDHRGVSDTRLLRRSIARRQALS